MKQKHVDFALLVPVEEMSGDDEAETAVLRRMLAHAEAYLKHYPWCPPIRARHFGLGVGGLLALFLFELERPAGDAGDRLWVMTGDLPSAYFAVDDAPDPIRAVEVYCAMMSEWARAVRAGGPLDHVFPVEVFPVGSAPTLEHAHLVEQRVETLTEFVELMDAGGVPPGAT